MIYRRCFYADGDVSFGRFPVSISAARFCNHVPDFLLSTKSFCGSYFSSIVKKNLDPTYLSIVISCEWTKRRYERSKC